MRQHRRSVLRPKHAMGALALLCFSAAWSSPTEPTPDELIDALNGVFGRHAGMRASHAHGFCAAGEFRPSPQLRQLSRAKLFKATSVPALIRLSIGGGNPKLSDKSRSVRGLAARLQGAGELYDLVMISEPVFFASTPEAFVSFLKARVPDPSTGKPDPERIKAHDRRFPSGRNQPGLLASHAAPASYATTPYFSNHAFRFISSGGQTSEARLLLQPAAGTAYLDSASEAQLPDRFLQAELQERLSRAPVVFTLLAQAPAPSDSLTDPSVPWAGAGTTPLGLLQITSLSPPEACDKTMFVPTVLPDGVEPSDDTLLRARAAAYGVSLVRRSK